MMMNENSIAGIQREFSLEKNQTLVAKIGCLRLWVRRVETEILIGQFLDIEIDEEFIITNDEIPEKAKVTRWAWKNPTFTLSIDPVLQEKDLVFRPTRPISIASKDRVDFYVSPCMRLKISFDKKFVTHLPIIEYSETWFGKDPTIGDLCYAVKTRATTNPESIIKKRYRFLCHLSIMNESDAPITIDKVKVLTEFIRLYKDQDGYVYSDELLLRNINGHSVKMSITSPDTRAIGLQKIFDARGKLQSVLLKSFSVMLEY